MALQEVAVQRVEEGQEGSKATSLERQLPNKREVVQVALCTWPSTPLASTNRQQDTRGIHRQMTDTRGIHRQTTGTRGIHRQTTDWPHTKLS